MANDLNISREYQQDLSKGAELYNPDPEEESRVSTIRKRFQDRELSKRTYEKTWFVNGSFIRGQHNIAYNPGSRNFEIPFKIPQHRVRLVVNMMMAYFRRTKSRLTANKPGLFCRAATTDQEDIERARLNGKVLESELYRMTFRSQFRRTIGWTLECGSGLLYLAWNPYAGAPLFEEQPVLDEYGEQAIDPETGEPMVMRMPMVDDLGRPLREGQNELHIVSPYEFDIDPNATTLDDAEWIMRSKIRSLKWIRENYPTKGKFVVKESVEAHSFYERRIKQMVGMMGYANENDSGEGAESIDPSSAVVHEYWERPSDKYPKGRLIVVAGKVELWNGENPYRHGLFPFIKIDEVSIPGRFWGMAVIEQMIPLQKNLNRARSQEVENRTLMGRPKWLVPRSAKVRQSAFDAEAGEKVDYNVGPRGERPEIIHPPATTASTQAEIQHTLNDMQEVGAWHEASRGIMPSANAPAEAVRLLQSADDTSLGETANNIDEGLVRLGRMVLSNCSQFWTEERLVRAGGEGARLEAMKVMGRDMAGEDASADYFDVRIIAGSTLLRDPEQQRSKVYELLQLGLLHPVAHRDTILKMLDVAEIEQAFEDERQDEQWAEKENELMEQGIFNLPRDFENHEVHLKVIDRFRKSERYRRLPPQIQQLFDQHAAMHKQLAVAVGQEQLMMQAMVESVLGAPGGEGEQQPGSQAPQQAPAAA